MTIIICDRCGNRVEPKDPQTVLDGNYSVWPTPQAENPNTVSRHVDLCGPCTMLLVDFIAKRAVPSS